MKPLTDFERGRRFERQRWVFWLADMAQRLKDNPSDALAGWAEALRFATDVIGMQDATPPSRRSR